MKPGAIYCFGGSTIPFFFDSFVGMYGLIVFFVCFWGTPHAGYLDDHLSFAADLPIHAPKELLEKSGDFKRARSEVFTFALGTQKAYIHFVLPASGTQILHLHQAFISQAYLYVFDGEHLVQSDSVSNSAPAYLRPGGRPNISFQIQEHTKPRQVFLVLQASPKNQLIRPDLYLSAAQEFYSYKSQKDLKFGCMLGILGVGVIIGLFLFFYDKRFIYITYSLYVINLICILLSVYGYLNDWFGAKSLGNDSFYHFCLMSGSALQLVFVGQFLRVYFKRSTFIAMNGIAVVFFFMGVWALVSPYYSSNISRISILCLGVFITLITLRFCLKTDRIALFYVVAVLPSIMLILYFLGATFGIFSLYRVAYDGVYFSAIWEKFVLGFGLLYLYSKQKSDAEKSLFALKQNTTKQLVESQEAERMRLATDLHDDLGATLSILTHSLETKKDLPLEHERQIARRALEDLRQISHNLNPAVFEQKGLADALEEMAENAGIGFIKNGTEKVWDTMRQLSLYRIAKELVSNALKHANATKIDLQLIYFEHFVFLSVEDNGQGFEPDRVEYTSEILAEESVHLPDNKRSMQNKSAGIGLSNISLRVNYLGGKWELSSGLSGTTAMVEIPYVPSENTDR